MAMKEADDKQDLSLMLKQPRGKGKKEADAGVSGSQRQAYRRSKAVGTDVRFAIQTQMSNVTQTDVAQ